MHMDAQFFADHFRYSRWATAKLLQAAGTLDAEPLARDQGSSFGGVLGTLTHIFQADRLWLSRVQGVPRARLAEPDENPTLEQLESEWLPVLDEFIRWADGLQDPEALLEFRSVVLKRDAEVPLWQALLHIVNHATYHRGQVATMLKQLGAQPPSTDLIFYCLECQTKSAGQA